MKKIISILIILLLPLVANSQTWQAKSGDTQVAVLELFTSEGCGLCPAADRWVHDLPKQGITDENVIVLGFHIDYLNDIKGWVDRFASPVFTKRQRQQAHLNLYQTVYTPEFVVSGEVIHNWKKHVKDVIHAVNGFSPEVTVNLIVSDNGNELIVDSHIQVEGKENRQYATLYLAVTENDLVSKVRGGDNTGVTFNHQNLVRQWLGPFTLNSSGETDISTSIILNNEWDMNKLSIIAIVQNLDDGFVLQGLKLPLSEHLDH